MMMAVHSFRAIIHPCGIDMTDRAGRLEQMDIREHLRAAVSQWACRIATSGGEVHMHIGANESYRRYNAATQTRTSYLCIK